MGLVDYNKYTIANAVEREVNLPTIGGFIPLVTDKFTVDTTGTNPVYKTYMLGTGSVLTVIRQTSIKIHIFIIQKTSVV